MTDGDARRRRREERSRRAIAAVTAQARGHGRIDYYMPDVVVAWARG